MCACASCDRIIGRRQFKSPHEYKEFARCLIETVQEGLLLAFRVDCPPEDILRPSWPEADLVAHFFECTHCGRKYQFSVDLHNGNASWEPDLDPPLQGTTNH